MFSSRAVTKKIAMVRMRRRPWLLVGMVAFVLTVAMGGLMLLRADAAERENSFSSTSFRSEGYDGGGDRFEFVIVSDMDGDTPREARYGFVSHLRHGTLVREGDGQYVIEWKEKGPGVPLRSKLHKKNRGMELSEMEIFEGKVIAADDRTGILYHVKHPFGSHAVVDPWIQLYDGDGKARNGGFKCEWTVVKDGILYVGSHGREVTKPNDGSAVKNRDRMWVKTIDREGTIKHHNWTQRFDWLRTAAGASFPGYLIHEAVIWDDLAREWLLFPRRYSTEPFDEVKNELHGWNHALRVNEDFTDLVSSAAFPQLETRTPRGFSTVKFVPQSNNTIVLALRTVEISATSPEESSQYETYVSVLNVKTMAVLMEEERVVLTAGNASSKPANVKYEGLTFLPARAET